MSSSIVLSMSFKDSVSSLTPALTDLASLAGQ